MKVINVADHVIFGIPEKEDNAIEALVRYVIDNAREQNHNTGTVKRALAYDILVDDCLMLNEWLEDMSIDENGQLHIGGDIIPRGKVIDWLNSDFGKGGRDE